MERERPQYEIPISNLLAIAFSENRWKISKNNLMNLMYKYAISLIDSGYKLNINFKRLPSTGWWSSEIYDEILYWKQNGILLTDKIHFIINDRKYIKFVKKEISSFPESSQINGILNGAKK